MTQDMVREGVPVSTVVMTAIAVFLAGLLVGGFVLRFGPKGPQVVTCPQCPKEGPRSAVARRSGDRPDRLSVFIPPKKRWDREAFLKDPEAFLKDHLPGMVWQPKQPGPKVPILRPKGKMRWRMRQGETVAMQVRAPAGFPVVFSAMDLGRFGNELTSIIRKADSSGVATAHYTAAAGALSHSTVLCACPEASGQVAFRVFIDPPGRTVPKQTTESSTASPEGGPAPVQEGQ